MRKSTVDVRAWSFDLTRFDEPDPPADPVDPPADPPADPPVDPPADPPADPDKGKAKDPEAEIAKWKAMARKHEATAKANSEAAKKLADIEEAQKTEAQKLVDKAEAAEQRAAAAIERAVKAEVKALAANDFADVTDAEAAIKASDYVDSNGEIDVDAIKAKLAELLEAKPHWKKPTTPAAPPKPKPDPSQGARGGEPKPTNFKDADKADFEKELESYGLKARS